MYSFRLGRLLQNANGGNRMVLSLPIGGSPRGSIPDVRNRRDTRDKRGLAPPHARLCLGIGDGSVHRQ